MGEEDKLYYPKGYAPKRRTMKEIKSDFNKYQQKLYSKRKG